MATEATHETPGPTVAIDWPTRIAMVAGGLMVTLALIGVSIVLPQIDKALAHDTTEHLLVKLLAAIVGFTMVIGAPLTGFLIDRVGPRPIMMVSAILYAIAGTAGLYVNDLMTLFASRLVVGLTASAMATTGMALINTHLVGQQRARWMGAHVSVALIGSLILQPTIGRLGEIGWRAPFALYAISLVLVFIAARLQDVKPQSVTSARPAADRLMQWFPFRFMGLAFIVGTVSFLPAVYLPFVIRDAGVSSPQIISYVTLADSVLAAVMSTQFGRSQRYLSPHAALMICFICTGTGMCIAAATHSLMFIVCGTLIYGCGLGWMVPAMMTAAAKHMTAEQQGRATGLIKSTHYLAMPMGVLLVERITRAVGSHGALWSVSVLSLVGVATFAARIASRQAAFRAMPAVAAQDAA